MEVFTGAFRQYTQYGNWEKGRNFETQLIPAFGRIEVKYSMGFAILLLCHRANMV